MDDDLSELTSKLQNIHIQETARKKRTIDNEPSLSPEEIETMGDAIVQEFSGIDDKFFDFKRYSGSPTALDDFVAVLESLNRRIPNRIISYVIDQLSLEEEENPEKNYNKKQFLRNLVSCNLSKLNGQDCAAELGIKYDPNKTRVLSEEPNKRPKASESSFLPPIKAGRRKTQRKYRKRKNARTIKHKKRRKN
jgi:hypothetical protein